MFIRIAIDIIRHAVMVLHISLIDPQFHPIVFSSFHFHSFFLYSFLLTNIHIQLSILPSLGIPRCGGQGIKKKKEKNPWLTCA